MAVTKYRTQSLSESTVAELEMLDMGPARHLHTKGQPLAIPKGGLPEIRKR